MGDENQRILEYNRSNASTFAKPQYSFSLSVSADLINISKKTFFNFAYLQHATLYEGIETIGQWAFCHCHDLQEIAIPSTVNKIEQGAFSKCIGLKIVVFSKPSPSTHLELELGPRIFSGCENLRTLDLRPGIIVIPKQFCFRCSSLKEVKHLGATIKIIEESAFERCKSLWAISLPSSTQKIGIKAFFGCQRLNAKILFSEMEAASEDCLEIIDDSAFAHCSDLESVRVPSSVHSVGKYSFERCEDLESVELSLSTLVHPSTFSYCKKLKNIEIGGLLQPTGSEGAMVSAEGLSGCTWLVESSKNGLDPGTDNAGNLLLESLCHRWDDMPIHRLCYYQAHHPVEVTIEAMEQARERLRNNRADSYTRLQGHDEFGLTPSRILELSTKPRYDIFAQIIRYYSRSELMSDLKSRVFDRDCDTPVIPGGTAIATILRAIVSLRIPQLRLRSWRMITLQCIEEFEINPCWYDNSPEDILGKLEYFEYLEGLALLEQAVWNIAIAVYSAHQPSKRVKTNVANDQQSEEDRRQACRARCGANVVMHMVLPYLGKVEARSFSRRFPIQHIRPFQPERQHIENLQPRFRLFDDSESEELDDLHDDIEPPHIDDSESEELDDFEPEEL